METLEKNNLHWDTILLVIVASQDEEEKNDLK